MSISVLRLSSEYASVINIFFKPLYRLFCILAIGNHCVKSIHIQGLSGPYFPAFGLNTERYRVSLRILSECGKIRTTKKSKLDTFHTVQRLLFVETAVRKIDTQHKCFPVKIAKLLKTPFFIKHL